MIKMLALYDLVSIAIWAIISLLNKEENTPPVCTKGNDEYWKECELYRNQKMAADDTPFY